MKTELSSIEVKVLTEEFRFLIGSRIEKIFDSDGVVIFQLYSKEGKKFLNIEKKMIYLCSEKREGLKLSTFCKVLRKYLENKRIKEIKQHNAERIITISTENNNLIIELFGQTNIILCDRSNNVINCLRTQKTGNIVIPKTTYTYPEKGVNIFKIEETKFFDIIKNSDLEIVKTIARFIGGIYAEEVCLRAGVDKNKKHPSKEEIKQLHINILKLLSQQVTPFVIYDGDDIIDAVPFDLEIYNNFSKVAFSNFYEALDFFVQESKKNIIKEDKYSKQIKKVEEIISIQKKQIEELKKEYEFNKRAGEIIYENYGELQNIISSLKNLSNTQIEEAKKVNKKIISFKGSILTVDL
ncbi:MAG: NFACT family protein [Candidatus Woesearchaeota archaeon]